MCIDVTMVGNICSQCADGAASVGTINRANFDQYISILPACGANVRHKAHNLRICINMMYLFQMYWFDHPGDLHHPEGR